MIQLRRILKEDYPDNKTVIYEYTSAHYYEAVFEERGNGWSIDFTLKPFGEPFHKREESLIFVNYLENLECYIAELEGQEAGVINFHHEKWNNVVRIHDIQVDPSARCQGIGSVLMAWAKKRASEIEARAIVLETQTSNYPAIQFYQKHGFRLTRCDLISYSNEDVHKKEVRIEMGLRL